ncbi:ABC transporter substrate-binding protein [Sphingomicrobium astaxanthinifaciens]|uniref:ABC transporter substrate-binding protein n=1 Tax=Sphingomicrobium astaxanthinifaciens TaxID=1227949 RepID=UPI001FCC99BB|nr:ABC transporter substrate-binding protein [Sphingomicrobium astaxanthinifaciens]MCJ7421833.1 ABC transporter substrate-binding protein [Sphingomicrobium astaxanthinifaciens]
MTAPRPAPRRSLAPLLAAAALGCLAIGCAREPDREVRIAAIDEMTSAQLLDAALAQGLVRFDAAGEIEQGLATSWHVSDDGLSYIFRLDDSRWPGDEPVTAPDVARLLEERFADPRWADEFGAVEDVRAMTDKVIEIRLAAPQRHFLQLLARPELAIEDARGGTGPFSLLPVGEGEPPLVGRVVEDARGELAEERVRITTLPVAEAIARFGAGEVDLVTGGTFADVPLALAASNPFGAPRFDPVAGLFGLVPTREAGPLATPQQRRALSAAIDRDALIAALGVRSLLPRATVLQAGTDTDVRPIPPDYVDQPMDERRAESRAAIEAAGLAGTRIAIALPQGPGADILFTRLAADWGAIGLEPTRVTHAAEADLQLLDEVAPATHTGWFLRRFTCARVTVCDPATDELLDRARASADPDRRDELLREAADRIEAAQLFLPLAAPVRWSLVAPTLEGFAENRFARHFVGGLRSQRRR